MNITLRSIIAIVIVFGPAVIAYYGIEYAEFCGWDGGWWAPFAVQAAQWDAAKFVTGIWWQLLTAVLLLVIWRKI